MNSPIHALASTITEKFILAAPSKAAAALESLATHEVLQLIAPLKAQVIMAVLNEMDPPKAAAVLRRLPLRQASYVLARLQVPQAAKLMTLFSGPYRERISAVLEPAFVQLLKGAATYGADAVGGVMQTDFVAVRTDTKLAQLIERLKNLPRKKLPLVCFVTGKNDELKGAIATAELVFFNPQAVCGSVMNKTVRALKPQDELSAAQVLFAQQETVLLPVVNGDGLLMGALSKEAVLAAAPTKKTLWDKLTAN